MPQPDRHTFPPHGGTLTPTSLATLEFELAWRCADASHVERILAPQVNLWRDIFPPGIDDALIGKRPGDVVTRTYAGNALAGPRRTDQVRRIRLSEFDGALYPGLALVPRAGRFYPQGTLHRAGLGGVFRETRTPFRIIEVGDDHLVCDLNPAFTGRPADVTARVLAVAQRADDPGGRSNDWTAELLRGAGMQARSPDRPTDFFADGWSAREADGDDAAFYATPRLVAHLDSRALETVTALYARHLGAGMRVLDLMSADRSHLPAAPRPASVTGLGMNADELAHNPALTERVVHDLNRDPRLPFADASFDLALCTVSIEYLIDPLAVMREVARVLAPGARFVVTFSNRWFPPKVTRLWRDAHPYERLGFVLEAFLRSGAFGDLHTEIVRGYPRPTDDPHAHEAAESDPVFAAWGTRTPPA